MDAALIDHYEAQSKTLRQAVAGLLPADLNAFPVKGTWSIQQIMVHVMDSDLIWTDRTKRIIAEENPSLIGYDESKFTSALHYDLWSIEDVLTIFELNRRNFARVLRLIPDSALERKGMHSERGEIHLRDMVPHLIEHVEHHLKFIRQKRQLLGKALKD
jgi:uncharacterized damage-inducible protein DinB